MHANGGLLIMNDDLQAAVACSAQGVHLGQSDGDPAAARAALPPGAVVGWSTHTIEHIEAVHPTVDYIGFGPLFGTSTKSTPYSPRHSLLSAALHAAGSRPLVGIGGLTPSALPGLRAIGLRHWAAISALYTAPTLRLGVAAPRCGRAFWVTTGPSPRAGRPLRPS